MATQPSVIHAGRLTADELAALKAAGVTKIEKTLGDGGSEPCP